MKNKENLLDTLPSANRWVRVSDIRRSYNFNNKISTYNLLGRFVFRPISFHLAALLVNFKISANQATGLSGVFALSTLLCLVLGPEWSIWASLSLVISLILDYADGSIARYLDTASYYGRFLDAAKDKIFWGFLPFCLAIGSTQLPSEGRLFSDFIVMLLGALAGMLYLSEQTVGYLYGRWIRQVKLDGKDFPACQALPYPAVVNFFLVPFLRLNRVLMYIRQTGFTIGLIILVPLGHYEWLLLAAFVLFTFTSTLTITELFLRASRTMNRHRRSKSSVEDFYESTANL